MRLLPLALLVACAAAKTDPGPALAPVGDDTASDTDDTDTVAEAPLGDPFLAMVAATPADYLVSTCTVRVDVYEGGVASASNQFSATGGEWAGIALAGETQYTATATYDLCNDLNPSGEYTAGTFSGVAGYLFLFWYNGVNGGYTALTQGEHFVGGAARVVYDPAVPDADVQARAAGIGVTATLEGTEYALSWTTETNVGEVLSFFAQGDGFQTGTPEWIEAPYWW